jgi:hypothetical protein
MTLFERFTAFLADKRMRVAGYATQLLGLLEEARFLDWGTVAGFEHAGRITFALGTAILICRCLAEMRNDNNKDSV